MKAWVWGADTVYFDVIDVRDSFGEDLRFMKIFPSPMYISYYRRFITFTSKYNLNVEILI